MTHAQESMPRQRQLLCKLFFLLSSFLFSSQVSFASDNYKTSVFLENITHLITWPENDNPNFSVCVLNNKEIMASLQTVYADKTFKKKPIHISDVSSGTTAAQCDILFIGKNTQVTSGFVQTFSRKPTLTISDVKSLSTEGVMITVFEKDNRIACMINHKAIKEANIRISYLLLKSAYEVIE